MKKKLLVFITVICMMFACGTSVFAAEKVSEDAYVQAAYEAYLAIGDALYTTGDYAALKAAYTELGNATTDIEKEAKSAEWNQVIENNGGVEKYVNDVMNMAFTMMVFEESIEDEPGLMADYKAAPDLKKAYELVDTYEVMEADNVLMDKMADDLSVADVYAQAEADVTAAGSDVIAVYEAYVLVNDAVTYADDFDEAIAAFETVLDIFNEGLDDKEKADLAVLVGAKDWEETFSIILGDWVNLNVAAQTIDVGEAFVNDPNEETAKAFIEQYDAIFNDPDYADDDLRTLVKTSFDVNGQSIDEVYEDAMKILDVYSEGETIPEPEGESSKTDGSNPDTGDDFNVLPFAAIMLLAAAGMGAAVIRRRA